MARGAFLRWQLGLVLVIVTLGLLGALLQRTKLYNPEDTAEDTGSSQHLDGVKWAFYAFAWLSALYFYGFTASAYTNSLNC